MAPKLYIVSLDVGTFGCGLAYCRWDSQRRQPVGTPRLHDAWPGQPKGMERYPKTRSAILYDGSKQVVAWDWSARQHYLKMQAGAQQHDEGSYTYIENFKLALRPDSGYQLPPGFRFKTVASDFLRLLGKVATNSPHSTYGSPVRAEDVQWCLTVPAMWDDQAKHAMREAAVMAGLIRKAASDDLLIVLEPEAAAIQALSPGIAFCGMGLGGCMPARPLPAFAGAAGMWIRSSLGSCTEGSTVMVVDAGGGTVDITLAKVVKAPDGVCPGINRMLAEVLPGKGLLCGSSSVDKQWEAHLATIVGPAALDQWRSSCPAEYLHLCAAWEAVKCDFDPYADVRIYAVALPPSLLSLVPADRSTDLVDCTDEYGTYSSVELSSATVQSFFDAVLDPVVDACRDLLDKLAGTAGTGDSCKEVLLAGGFGGSPYLLSRLRKALATYSRNVTSVPNPSSAVATGALVYGCRPHLIGARCMRRAYGVGPAMLVSSWPHPIDPAYADVYDHPEEHVPYVHPVFDKLVDIGEQVGMLDVRSKTYVPHTRASTSTTFNIYCTDDDAVMYTEHPAMRKLGSVQVKLPPGWSKRMTVRGRKSYCLEVEFQFGTSEIKVTVTNEQTGEAVETTVNFE